MKQQTNLRPVPPSLPSTTEAYLAHRKLKARRTINDIVEEFHLKLIEDEKYAALLWATYDEQAVEKSLVIDDTLAAQMLRTRAVKDGNNELAGESLAVIVHALRIVLKRYGFSRKERRNMVGGVAVEVDEDDAQASED